MPENVSPNHESGPNKCPKMRARKVQPVQHATVVSRNNPWGCTPCFCYGHTDECGSAPRMVSSSITSDFSRGPEDWVAEESGRPTTSSYNAYQVRVGSNVRVEMFVFRDW